MFFIGLTEHMDVYFYWLCSFLVIKEFCPISGIKRYGRCLFIVSYYLLTYLLNFNIFFRIT